METESDTDWETVSSNCDSDTNEANAILQNEEAQRELFVCNLFWLVNDSTELKKANYGWEWGTGHRFIRLEKTVKKGPMIKTKHNSYGDWMYPLRFRYDVVWDGALKAPQLLLNVYDREGNHMPSKSVSQVVGLPLYTGIEDELSLDVMIHPFESTPYFCLVGHSNWPRGEWSDVKNPVLAYLLKYGGYLKLSPKELLKISRETPSSK